MRKIPLPRVLAEGAIIVASILLAFWIDAWWEDRQHEKTEIVQLQALLGDLAEKQAYLEYRRQYNLGIEAALNILLDESAHAELSDAEIDRQIGFTWWYNNPSGWQSAPLNSIVAGGDLFGVSNPLVLKKLTELKSSLDDLTNVSANDQNFHNEVLFPFYIEHANLVGLANASEHAPGHPEVPYVFPVFRDSGQGTNRAMLAKPQFRNLMVAKLDKLTDINQDFPGLEMLLNESISMIQSELEDL